jgi:hypothetical protein
MTRTPVSAIDIKCRLCGGGVDFAFKATVRSAYEVGYFRCQNCKSLQTEPPYWLDEAYGDDLAHLDFGAVQRNLSNQAASWLVARLWGLNDALDYGGGDGLLCRMLRDHGINCYVWDKHWSATYAQTFTEPDFATPQILFSFEVFEHFAHPELDLREVFGRGAPVLLASTAIYQGQDSGWFYLARFLGQHVFFYSAEAMELIARRFGYTATISGPYILFVRPDVSKPVALAVFKAMTTRIGLRALRALMAVKRAPGVEADAARLQRPRQSKPTRRAAS